MYLKAGRGMRRFGMQLGGDMPVSTGTVPGTSNSGDGTIEPSFFDKISSGVKDLFDSGASATAGVLQTVAATPTTTTVPVVTDPGMGTTTKLAIAGGAVLVAALLLRRK